MLEAMQERQSSIGGVTYKMPGIFIVIATQNPIEQEGTYLLAEAQLDRFLIKEKITYPTAEEEIEILTRIEQDVFSNDKPVLKLKDVEYIQGISKKVYIDEAIKKYIVEIIYATRNPSKYISKDLSQYIELRFKYKRCNIIYGSFKSFSINKWKKLCNT